MTTIQETVLDRFLDPFADCFTPEVARRVVDMRLAPHLQAHIDDLAKKASKGELTASEMAEYEEIVEAIDLIAIIKAKARQSLARRN